MKTKKYVRVSVRVCVGWIDLNILLIPIVAIMSWPKNASLPPENTYTRLLRMLYSDCGTAERRKNASVWWVLFNADGTIVRRFCEMCCVHHYNSLVFDWFNVYRRSVHFVFLVNLHIYEWMQKEALTHTDRQRGKTLTIQTNESKHRIRFLKSHWLSDRSIEEFSIEIIGRKTKPPYNQNDCNKINSIRCKKYRIK